VRAESSQGGAFRLPAYGARGWGMAGALVVRVDECAESAGLEMDPAFRCEFLGGFLGGIVEAWWGRDVEVTETRCDGRGDDACEFDLKAVASPRIPARTHASGATKDPPTTVAVKRAP